MLYIHSLHLTSLAKSLVTCLIRKYLPLYLSSGSDRRNAGRERARTARDRIKVGATVHLPMVNFLPKRHYRVINLCMYGPVWLIIQVYGYFVGACCSNSLLDLH